MSFRPELLGLPLEGTAIFNESSGRTLYAGATINPGDMPVGSDGGIMAIDGEITQFSILKSNSQKFETVVWRNTKGVLQGKDGNVFDPPGVAKRSEIAALLTRYFEISDI